MSIFRSSVGQFGAVSEAKMAMEASFESAPSLMAETPPMPAPVNYWPYVFGIAAVVFAVALIYLLVRSAQYKRQLGKSLTKK